MVPDIHLEKRKLVMMVHKTLMDSIKFKKKIVNRTLMLTLIQMTNSLEEFSQEEVI